MAYRASDCPRNLTFSHRQFFLKSLLGKALLAFCWFVVSNCSYSADVDDYLMRGRGDEAIDNLIRDVETLDGKDRVGQLSRALDLCIFIGDNKRFERIFEQHFKEYSDQGDVESVIRAHYFHLYYSFVTKNEAAIRELLGPAREAADRGFGVKVAGLKPDNRFRAATTSLVVQSMAYADLLTSDNFGFALQTHLMESALILDNGVSNWYDEMLLSMTIENSEKFDYLQARYFYKALKGFSGSNHLDLNFKMNPYAKLRIFLAIFSSMIANESDTLVLANEIHAMSKALFIPPGGVLEYRLQQFYFGLALEQSDRRTRVYGFKPAAELDRISSLSGGNFLPMMLAIVSDSTDSEVVEMADRFLSLGNEDLGPLLYDLVNALKSRAEGDRNAEISALMNSIDNYSTEYAGQTAGLYFSKGTFSFAEYVVFKYLVNRLRDLGVADQDIVGRIFFVFQLLNRHLTPNIFDAYVLLDRTDNSLQIDQIINRVAVNERLERQSLKAYGRIVKNFSQEKRGEFLSKYRNLEYGAGTSAFDPLLGMFWGSRNQLGNLGDGSSVKVGLEKRAADRQLTNIDHSTVIAAAEINGEIWVATLDGPNQILKIVEAHEIEFGAAREVLNSQNLGEFSEFEIRKASLVFSRHLFGDSYHFNKDNLVFCFGPTLSGVPVSLLSDPSSEDWLVTKLNLYAFTSPAHMTWASRKDLRSSTSIGYVAFANPKLVSSEETKKISAVEQMIRGSTSGVAGLVELPETEEEARILGKTTDKKQHLFFGKDASVDSLFSIDFQEVGLLSFNTHGVMAGELEASQSAALILSPTQKHDGIVPIDWLFSIKGAPRVVVLAACNSATKNQNMDSASLTSISDAFLLKGSSAVISSYWPVNSLATSFLFEQVGSNVLGGMSWAAALNESIRALIASKEFSHPVNWAAFVATGDYYPPDKNSIGSVDDVNYIDLGGVRDSVVVHGPNEAIVVMKEVGDTEYKSISVAPTTLSIDSFKASTKYLGTEKVIISSNQESGIFFATQGKSGVTSFHFPPNKFSRPGCAIQTQDGEKLYDFLLGNDVLFALLQLDREALAVDRLVIMNPNNCEFISGAYKYALDAGDFKKIRPSTNLYPGPTADSAYLVFQYDLDVNQYTESYYWQQTELGHMQKCIPSIATDVDLINKSGVVLSRNAFKDVLFLDTERPSVTGIRALEKNSCDGSVQARYVKTKWLSDEYLFWDESYTRIREQEISELEKQVNDNFAIIRDWWSVPGGDYIYVRGTPSRVLQFYSHLNDDVLERKSLDLIQNIEDAIYVKKTSARQWTRLGEVASCNDSVFPLTFKEIPSVACLQRGPVGSDFSNLQIRSYGAL